MITAYTRQNGKTSQHSLSDGAPLPPGTVWVDLLGCSPAQVAQFSQLIKQTIPPLRDVRLLEQARQQYVEKGTTYLTAPIIIGSQTETPSNGVVLFVLSPQLLVTVREAESRALSIFATRALDDHALLHDSETVFVGLLEAIVHRLADLTEITAHELEQVGRIVFSESLQRSKSPGQGNPASWRKIMIGLGKAARLNHRLLATLTGLDRLLAFLQSPQEPCVGETSYARLRSMQHDIKRLIDHSGAMINEATFLLDAIASAISIEQNNVVKIFSMVAVILMPPTMIASIYGMNFAHMPELNLWWGYPLALLAMLLSAILPWLWFKRSGWF
jgi:magnesium transporter